MRALSSFMSLGRIGIQMQNQIQSYSYQLNQGCEDSFLACHSQLKNFYVGTCIKDQAKGISYIYNLKYDDENPRKSPLITKTVEGRITGLFPFYHPDHEAVFVQLTTKNGIKLKKFSSDFFDQQASELQEVVSLPQEMKSLVFHKNEAKGYMCGVRDIWRVDANNFEAKEEVVQSKEDITHCLIDPIHQLLTYSTASGAIKVLDKTMKKEQFIIQASRRGDYEITGIDYNSNKQYGLLTAHHQCLKFWDIRKGNLPIKCMEEHHSLIVDAKYNHSHDELLACCYDDGSVGLYRASSVSSAPVAESEDAQVKLYDEHEDSVYKLIWANFSPWLFSTVSYNAASLVVNMVPSVEKYRILL